jgi:hypothetical protein
MSQELNRNQNRPRDWRELCEAAAIEPDPAKLIALISEINRAFDEMDKKRNTALENIDPTNGDTNTLRMKYTGEL